MIPKPHRISPGPVWAAAASYFAAVFGVGFLLGVIRVLFLLPRLGQRAAELLEMPFMLVAIVLAAGRVVRIYGRSGTHWAGVGLLALAFLMTAECLLAVSTGTRSLDQYLAKRDPVSGTVYLLMLLVFAVMPAVRQRLSADHAQAD